jgi:hypothetical protein
MTNDPSPGRASVARRVTECADRLKAGHQTLGFMVDRWLRLRIAEPAGKAVYCGRKAQVREGGKKSSFSRDSAGQCGFSDGLEGGIAAEYQDYTEGAKGPGRSVGEPVECVFL